MRKALILSAAAGAVGLTSAALATPYASAVSETGGNVSFTLNEDGANVTIFRDGTPQTFGTGLAKGSYSFARSGAAQYSIRVTKAASPGYAVISTAARETNFELPRGVAVNNNPGASGAPNPLFGRVYVSNGRSTTTAAGRPMSDGIYLLKADLTSAVAQGDTARTAGINMTADATTSGVDPFRLAVGPDNRLYITHFSDLNAGLFDTDADVLTHRTTFDPENRSTTGLNETSGSVTDVVVTGTGANRRIFTTDEDLNTNQRGIYRYDIGTADVFTGPPSAVPFSDPGNAMQNSLQSVAIDSRGKFWLSQNRAGGADTLPSLLQIDTDGSVLFSSLSLSGNGTSAQDPLRATQGMAYDPVNDVIALVSNRAGAGGTGLITIFDAEDKTVLTSFPFAITGAGTNTDVAFDAAGNLYVVNRTAERLVVWSPGGESIATTFSDGSFTVLTVVPEPAVVGLVGMGGLLALARRRRHTA